VPTFRHFADILAHGRTLFGFRNKRLCGLTTAGTPYKFFLSK
jgi:hypothetical protein